MEVSSRRLLAGLLGFAAFGPFAPSSPAAGIEKIKCNSAMTRIFDLVAERKGNQAQSGYETSLRPELKVFADVNDSDAFAALVNKLAPGPQDARKDHGLMRIGMRDIPPEGKVFDTETVYIAASDGKFRGRLYRAGEEGKIAQGLEDFEAVQIADPSIDSTTGKPQEYIKLEMKVRRKATPEEPFMDSVVDKPGVVMLKKDFDLLMKSGHALTPADWHRIYKRTAAITRKGKPLNDENEINFLFKSYEDFDRLKRRATGVNRTPDFNARVNYVRDAYEYKFARKDMPAGAVNEAQFPKEFVVQHTVDRKIRIVDLHTGDAVEFPEGTRANEVKSPLSYAKLFLSGDSGDRKLLVDMGLQDYIDFMQGFFDMKPMEPSQELKDAGFEFIRGKGKFSTGSRLLDASTPSP